MIRVEHLVKTFNSGTKAVNDVNLHVEQGEIFALLGPNGAGKSTTIKVLSTLCGFDTGKVHVAGYDVDKDPKKVRESIGLVAQQTGIDYFLTGRENLLLHGHLYHMPKKEIVARINDLSEYFELTEVLDKQVMTYSGGIRRKLDIACALIHQPKVLFLDEPTLGLDIKSRKNLWQYVEKLNNELNLTILLTTHYLEEADHLAHRVAIINEGSISIVDTPEALKDSIGGDVITLSFSERNTKTHTLEQNLKEQPYIKKSLWEGSRLHLYVDHGASCIPKIAALSAQNQLQMDGLSLSRPTLDDAFIQYTGSSIEGHADKEDGEEWWHQWAGKGGGKWQKKWQEQPSEGEPESNVKQEEQWSDKETQGDETKDATPSPTQDTDAAPTTQDEHAAASPTEQWGEDESENWQKWQNKSSSDQDDWQQWQDKKKES